MTTEERIVGINTGANWKNVNNWHWVDKNCNPWAKEYFTKRLVGVEASDNGTNVKVSSMSSFSGDVDLNQRKGKIITIFDLEMKLKWEGTNPEGKKAKGTIHIPEFMFDTSMDEIVFDISLDVDDKLGDAIKAVVRKSLVPKLRSQFNTFTHDLVTAHQHDVYIPPEKLANQSIPATKYSPKPPVSSSASQKKVVSQVIGGMSTVKQSIEFVCSAEDIFTTLLDPQRVSIWTRAQATISPAPGDFALFGSNIMGKITAVERPSLIKMTWKQKTWPSEHYSDVTIEIDQGSNGCTINLTQKNVPLAEHDAVEKNWTDYYWNPIKATFGYGALL